MLRELVLDIGGIKIYAEAEETKKSLLWTIISMIRNAYVPLSERKEV